MTITLFTTALYAFACLVHEMGHAMAAQAFGLPWKLRLGWLGPYVRIRGRWIWYENAIVALAGPLASFAGASLCWRAGLPCCGFVVGLIGAGNLLPLPKADAWNAMQAWRRRDAKDTIGRESVVQQ
jgi:hypothetical protein